MDPGTGAGDFTGLVGWVVDVIVASGPTGVALLLALDNVVPVVPSEVVLPFAGYLVAQERLAFWPLAVAATLGSTVSAFVYFELGRRLGPERARAAMCRIPLMDGEDVERASCWFERHGDLAVLTGRCVPFVRSVVSLPAGTEGMGRVRFGVLTAVGSGVWNLVWIAVGYFVGRSWHEAGRYSSWMNWTFLVILVAAVARYVWARRHRLPWT